MTENYTITIQVQGQQPFSADGITDNLTKELHEAIQLYFTAHYQKEEVIREFEKLENWFCKNCQEGTITEFYGQTSDGVKIRCTKCNKEYWL